MRIALPLLSLLLALPVAGCGGDDSTGTTADPPDIVFDLKYEGGDVSMKGTITLPESLESSVEAGLVLHSPPDLFSVTAGDGFTGTSLSAGTRQVTYEIKGLHKGEQYSASMAVDITGDAAFGPGDWAGFYGGTVEAPAIDPADAGSVTLTSSMEGVDFGLGVLTATP